MHNHEREYWVQVEGNITSEAIDQLQKGVAININGKMYNTKKCFAEKISQPAGLKKEIHQFVIEKIFLKAG